MPEGCLSVPPPRDANALVLAGAKAPDRAFRSHFWGAKCLKSGFWLENLRSIIEAQNRSPESTGPDEGISKRDHRGVHALGNRKPHKLLILRFFKPKSSRLARSSENNLQVQRHGSRSPASSYLDFLISAQLLTCRHQKSLVIILGLPGARQALRGTHIPWAGAQSISCGTWSPWRGSDILQGRFLLASNGQDESLETNRDEKTLLWRAKKATTQTLFFYCTGMNQESC